MFFERKMAVSLPLPFEVEYLVFAHLQLEDLISIYCVNKHFATLCLHRIYNDPEREWNECYIYHAVSLLLPDLKIRGSYYKVNPTSGDWGKWMNRSMVWESHTEWEYRERLPFLEMKLHEAIKKVLMRWVHQSKAHPEKRIRVYFAQAFSKATALYPFATEKCTVVLGEMHHRFGIQNIYADFDHSLYGKNEVVFTNGQVYNLETGLFRERKRRDHLTHVSLRVLVVD